MDFLPQSQVFLVTFGDGFVRQFDLRVATQLAAVNCDDVGLVGLGVEPRDGHTLALGGNDPFLRIYDLRKLSFHQESNLMNMITTPVVSLHSTAEMIRKHKKISSFSRFFSGHSDVCISGVCWDSCGRLFSELSGRGHRALWLSKWPGTGRWCTGSYAMDGSIWQQLANQHNQPSVSEFHPVLQGPHQWTNLCQGGSIPLPRCSSCFGRRLRSFLHLGHGIHGSLIPNLRLLVNIGQYNIVHTHIYIYIYII